MAETHAKTFRLRRSTIKRFTELARALGSYESPLLDKILNKALDDIAVGKWQVKKSPVKYDIHLD